jgi:Protein of unknown function (DUF3800)
MTDSDYIIYVDESGDHSLTSIDPNYPIFVVAFSIFEKATYAKTIGHLLKLKFDTFGHDMVVLHERDIEVSAWRVGRNRRLGLESVPMKAKGPGIPEARRRPSDPIHLQPLIRADDFNVKLFAK